MKACVKSGTKDDGNITFFIERHVESPNPVERRRRQIEVTLNSSNEHAEPVDKCSEPKDEHPPRRKRGKYAAYIKKKELSSMAEVKQAASSAGLKYINTVNRTAYFMCSIDGCPYKSRAVLTDEFRYDVLETDLQHNHGTVERKDGVSKNIKAMIIERINGNEAINPEAILQRAQALGIRQLPTRLQVKNCVAYLKRMLVPHFAKTSFADLELLVQEILTDEPDVFDVKYILNETNPQKSDFIIIFSCLSLMLKQRAQKHACVDGTWKLVHNNFVVLVFGFVDLNNHVHVTGVGIASSETTNVFKWIFEFFKSNRFTEGSWSPTEIMADNSRAISAAVLIVFPQAKRRNCYAHVIRACDTKMQELHFSADLRETTLSQIRELSRCPTETYFDLAAEALITEWSSAEYQSHKDFAIYFQRQYVELDKNWFAENGAGCRTDF